MTTTKIENPNVGDYICVYLEHGWIQRYKVYMGKNGQWYTLKKSPLQTPIQHPGRAFIRRAAGAEGEAIDAMKVELQKRLDGLYSGGA